MGLFDTILVWMDCPYCGFTGRIECQTKDLGNIMFTYKPLADDWFTKKERSEHSFRETLPVFPQFPLDKEYSVWKNQAELIEAKATLPKQFHHKKFIRVIASCNSVQCRFDGDRISILRQGCPSGFSRSFEGKIKIRDGKLIGKVYDIEKDEYTERKLNHYKFKYRKIFNKFKKKYKHEPIICMHWHEGEEDGLQNRHVKKKRKTA